MNRKNMSKASSLKEAFRVIPVCKGNGWSERVEERFKWRVRLNDLNCKFTQISAHLRSSGPYYVETT